MSPNPALRGRRSGAASKGRWRILIVDDHPLVREGLAARISAQPDLEVCGEASTIEEALALIRTADPDLVIADLALKEGNGLDLIKQTSTSRPGLKILVVSAYGESLFAERALRSGARGYINKQELPGAVIEAIRAVLRDELYLSAEMARRLAGQALGESPSPQDVRTLSNRELQVFELIGRGHSTREIAQQLQRSVHTIESHREKIRAKLNLRSGSELTQQAVRWILETEGSVAGLE